MNSSIEHLNGWGGRFFDVAWPICWQSSLLIALLFAGDLLLRRKLRASLRYALWLVVLVKLCVPPTLALPTSPVWWFHTSPPPVMAKPSLPTTTVTYNEAPQLDLPPIAEQPVYTPPPARLSAFGWLLLAAVGISAGLLVWMLARWWQVARLVRRAHDSKWLTALADEARRELRLRGQVPVKLTAQAMSPAVCGLFRPVILMPQSLATSLSEEQLRAVLLHELIHLRRGDVWVNLVQTLLQIGYWWHPLVWLANARLRRVREEAVDDAVMVALRGEAGLYAPTLLAVAKLALNRPLATLGLVGIMESRSVLRQRIERLLDFHPPRRAGLTLVSLLGVLAFTAVAVPMGQGPASEVPSSVGSDESASVTLQVNPEVFIRNVQAQAAKTLHATNDECADILMDILQGEGVDCIPPHVFVFNFQSGELTAKNSPSALEIFRQVIEQLNRADGNCELPLRDSPFKRPTVLISAQFYALPQADFANLVETLDSVDIPADMSLVGTIAAGHMADFNRKLAALKQRPFSRPRIQTSSGMTANFYVGTSTNGMTLGCRPLVRGQHVELAFNALMTGDLASDTGKPTVVVGDLEGYPKDLIGTLRHQMKWKVMAEDHGGIIVCANEVNDLVKTKLVVVLNVQLVTNTTAMRLNSILKPAGASATNAVSTSMSPQGSVADIMSDPNYRVALLALEQRSGAESLSEPEVTTTSGRGVNRMSLPITFVPSSNSSAALMSPQGSISGSMSDPNFRVAQRVQEQRSDSAPLGEPEVTASSGRQTQLRGGNAFANSLPADTKSGQLKPEDKKSLDGREHRKKNFQLLHTLRLERVAFNQMPLGEALRFLSEESRKHDPAGVGLNFMINPDPGQNDNPAVDPITGLPMAINAPTVAELPVLPMTVTLRTNVLLGDVLDALILGAPKPIRYSVQDYAVVFSAGGPQSQLYSRMFVLDTSAFISQLRKMKGVGEELGGATNASAVTLAARKYVGSLGVNLESPTGKAVVFNDQTGGLLVKASVVDLDVVERALGTLDVYRHSVSVPAAKTAAALVLEGKIHYEMGNLAEAEKVLKQALAQEPGNAAAQYYLDLIQAARRAQKNPAPPPSGGIQKPNRNQLNEVQLNRFGPFDHLPLEQVLQQVNAAIQPGQAGELRLTATAHARAVNIDLPAAVEPASLLNALAALVGSASQPIKFSLQEDGVIFSLKDAPEPASLLTRTYKVDTKAFLANLKETGQPLKFTNNSPQAIAEATAKLLAGLGVDIDQAKGKTVFFNHRTGILIVHATEADLDKIEQVVLALNHVPPQIHLKAWFYEVPEKSAGLMAKVPGVTNGLTAVLAPAEAADLIKTLRSIRGAQVLAAPEITARRGTQCQTKSGDAFTIVTNLAYREFSTDAAITNDLAREVMKPANIGVLTPQVINLECGPALEVTPMLSEDERNIRLTATASVTKFFGYAGSRGNFLGFDPPTDAVMTSAGDKITLPEILPVTQYNRVTVNLGLADGQTLVMFPQPNHESDPRRQQLIDKTEKKKGKKTLVVLVTASLVDAAGNLLAQTAAPAK